ncbi:MAG: pyrroline-5-carboxylate reductase [Mariniblastus sp.]
MDNLKANQVKTIGFIGAGQMAKSLAAGISSTNPAKFEFQISDPSTAACDSFSELVGQHSTVVRAANNQAVLDTSELVFLAVKPQYVDAALDDLKISNNPLIVSIVAGFQLFSLQRLTGTNRVIRVMPNTPCLIGLGASAVSTGDEVSVEDVELVKSFLASVGTVVEVEERLMDSVTGLSGSGPAYVLTFIESLIDGAVLTGMPRTIARELAIQTVLGTATMLQDSGEHPAVLRDRVTSPGGTTIEGLKSLEENSFRDAVMSAVHAASVRSSELGE